MRYTRPDWRRRRVWNRRRSSSTAAATTAVNKPLPEGAKLGREHVVEIPGPLPPGVPRKFGIQLIAPPAPDGYSSYQEFSAQQDAKAGAERSPGRTSSPSEASDDDAGWITVEVDEDASQANVEPRELIV